MTSRELFISEHRYISNILREFAGVDLPTNLLAVREYYAPPRTKSRVRFNNDYFLEFVEDRDRGSGDTAVYGSSILPNAIGAEVFLVVDSSTSKPLMTELLGGEAFPMRYFQEHIDKIEHCLERLSCPVSLRRAAYCRIFVIKDDICFLVFPGDASPIMRGKRELLCGGEESSIAISAEGAEIAYIDGWIRTQTFECDDKLEAIPVR